MPKVPLTENDIKEYLDNCIRIWRSQRDLHTKFGYEETFQDEMENIMNKKMAMCYVDAYQSVRSSLFGEVLEND